MAKDYPSIGKQFDELTEAVEAHQEKDTKLNEDALIFWDGYLAALNDLRYMGLILTAAKLKESL